MKRNQIWRSKTTGYCVTVIKITENVVWWEDKSLWAFPQQTTKDRFFETMEEATQ